MTRCTNASSNRLANKHYLKVADLAALESDYYKAIEHYERIGRSSINNNLMKWSVKDYFLKAGICHLATNVCCLFAFCPISCLGYLLTMYTRIWSLSTAPLKAIVTPIQPLHRRESTSFWLIWSRPLNKATKKPSPISYSSTTSSASSTSGRRLFYCRSRTISRKQGRISRRVVGYSVLLFVLLVSNGSLVWVGDVCWLFYNDPIAYTGLLIDPHMDSVLSVDIRCYCLVQRHKRQAYGRGNRNSLYQPSHVYI